MRLIHSHFSCNSLPVRRYIKKKKSPDLSLKEKVNWFRVGFPQIGFLLAPASRDEAGPLLTLMNTFGSLLQFTLQKTTVTWILAQKLAWNSLGTLFFGGEELYIALKFQLTSGAFQWCIIFLELALAPADSLLALRWRRSYWPGSTGLDINTVLVWLVG